MFSWAMVFRLLYRIVRASPESGRALGEYPLFDEFPLSFRVLKDRDDAACDAIRRILETRQFRSALRRAISQVVRPYPELAPVQIHISV